MQEAFPRTEASMCLPLCSAALLPHTRLQLQEVWLRYSLRFEEKAGAGFAGLVPSHVCRYRNGLREATLDARARLRRSWHCQARLRCTAFPLWRQKSGNSTKRISCSKTARKQRTIHIPKLLMMT